MDSTSCFKRGGGVRGWRRLLFSLVDPLLTPRPINAKCQQYCCYVLINIDYRPQWWPNTESTHAREGGGFELPLRLGSCFCAKAIPNQSSERRQPWEDDSSVCVCGMIIITKLTMTHLGPMHFSAGNINHIHIPQSSGYSAPFVRIDPSAICILATTLYRSNVCFNGHASALMITQTNRIMKLTVTATISGFFGFLSLVQP